MGEMQPKSDAQLLREYAETGAETAFTEIVHRHTNLVYSAALRQVESPEAAAEIAQKVFIGLARGARELCPRLAAEASLAGWLCRSARNLSLNFRRDEFRRQSRERQAMEQLSSIPDAAPDWERLRVALDDAMSELGERDYDALVLRFFENWDFRSVGQALGMSDDAAQKCVSRALEKLREHFSRRSINTTAAALSVALSANAVQAAPVGLAASISVAAGIAGSTAFSSTAISATKVIAMTTLQKTIVAATVTILAGTGIYESHQASKLRQRVQTLEQQQAPFAEQILQLRSERSDAINRMAELTNEVSQLKTDRDDLLRLRSEVGQLRRTADSDDVRIGGIIARGMEKLRTYFDQTPGAKTPELQFLTTEEWVNIVASSRIGEAGFDQNKAYRHAASELRSRADGVMGDMFRRALERYQSANGQFPSDLSQLTPYLERSKNRPDSDAGLENIDTILSRWKIVPATEVKGIIVGGDMVITQKTPVDDLYDERVVVGKQVGHRPFVQTDTFDVLQPVWAAYSAAHDTQPKYFSELQPYAITPEQKAALSNIIANQRWWE